MNKIIQKLEEDLKFAAPGILDKAKASIRLIASGYYIRNKYNIEEKDMKMTCLLEIDLINQFGNIFPTIRDNDEFRGEDTVKFKEFMEELVNPTIFED